MFTFAVIAKGKVSGTVLKVMSYYSPNTFMGKVVYVLTIYSGYYLYCLIQRTKIKYTIKAKQNELQEKKDQLFEQCSIDVEPSQVDEFTNFSLDQLLAKIENDELNPLHVLRAYQQKSLNLDKELNFIIDINTNSETDLQEMSNYKDLPLKGVPVSIKDSFFVLDCDCTWGVPHFIGEKYPNEHSLVSVVRQLGGVPFLITNMCQTGKSVESSNPIIGATANPHNAARTAGGSSGGEGAILGGKASIIGLGGDIGGSIRIPSTFCGIYGFKPSSYRLVCRHQRKKNDQDIIKSTVGPMARNIDDLIYFFKLLAGPQLHAISPYCPPVLFNDALYEGSKSLKIGMYTHLGGSHIKAIPAVKRAVSLAEEALVAAGHTVVEYELPDVDDAYNLFLQVMLNDGGMCTLTDLIGYDPVDWNIRFTVNLLRVPYTLKYILSYLVQPYSVKYAAALKAFCGAGSAYGVWKLKRFVEEYRETVMRDWEEKGLDGLICPVMPIAAPLLNTTSTILEISAYTAIFNLLDYPAGSVHVTYVNEDDQNQMKEEYPSDDCKSHEQIFKDHLESDEHSSVLGMPIGVQCVSQVWKDEVCLRIMKDVADNL